MGEAGAEVDAELGLQRSSTNPPLQTAPTESQMLTVAAGPGQSMTNQNGGRAQALGGSQFESKWGGNTLKDAKGDGLGPWETGKPGCRSAASGGVQPPLKTAS